jgi:hypothetical protein
MLGEVPGSTANRLETIGDASSPLVGGARPHKCSMACPHFAADWRRAVQATILGDDDGDDQSYADDGSQPQDDGSQDQGDQQQDQGPRGPSKAQKVGSFFKSAGNAIYTPIKYAAAPLVYAAKFGNQVLKTGSDVIRGGTKLAMAPLKLASKIFSIFGEEDWRGLPQPSHALLGVEDDEDYEDGDEEVVTRGDIFSAQEFDDAEDEDFYEAAELSPASQRMRFQTTEVAPGLWGGRVLIPRIDEPGRAFSMYASPARSEREAMMRMRNLAVQAAENPGVQLAVSPAALISLAAMKLGQSGKLSNALRSIGRFVQIQG